jgi:hypothetical protein
MIAPAPVLYGNFPPAISSPFLLLFLLFEVNPVVVQSAEKCFTFSHAQVFVQNIDVVPS